MVLMEDRILKKQKEKMFKLKVEKVIAKFDIKIWFILASIFFIVFMYFSLTSKVSYSDPNQIALKNECIVVNKILMSSSSVNDYMHYAKKYKSIIEECQKYNYF